MKYLIFYFLLFIISQKYSAQSNNPHVKDRLLLEKTHDSKNFSSGLPSYAQKDNTIFEDSTFAKSMFQIISEEVGVGLLTGAGAALSFGFIEYLIRKDLDFGSGLLGMYVGYTIGTAVGVYFIAHNQNSNFTLIESVSSSLIGSALGYYLFKVSNQKGIGSAMPLVMPVLFPILYANIFNPPNKEQKSLSFVPVINIHESKLSYNVHIQISL